MVVILFGCCFQLVVAETNIGWGLITDFCFNKILFYDKYNDWHKLNNWRSKQYLDKLDKKMYFVAETFVSIQP